MIYFIRRLEGGPIKIGTTISMTERLKKLRAKHGEGLQVLAVLDGDRDEEQDLHRRFAHLRDVGEWFEPGDDLLCFIAAEGKSWDGSDQVAAAKLTLTLPADLAKRFGVHAEMLGMSKSDFFAKLVRDGCKRFVVHDHAKDSGEPAGTDAA